MRGLPSGLSLHQPLLDVYQTELVIFLLHMKNFVPTTYRAHLNIEEGVHKADPVFLYSRTD